ncbi:MAG: hypothetical protein LBI29_02015 [Rickettsiales bacterium]|jgi:hypothetical protein|nr:hypothetical protein [Rickettsiales bacterium]
MFAPEAKSKGYLGIASVSRDANSTKIIFSDGRPYREIVRDETASSDPHFARNTMSLFYSVFSGKPVSENYNEPGVGDGVRYYDLSAGERVCGAMVVVGSIGIMVGLVTGSYNWIVKPATAVGVGVGVAGFIYSMYKSYTEADLRIDIRPDGVTRFGYFKFKFGEKELPEGEGTVLWPNGVGYQGSFENGLIKNNLIGNLIFFPEKNGYTVEFPNTKIPGKENDEHTFTNALYFNNTSYDRVHGLLEFADGDVFKGALGINAKGVYVSRNGTIVRDTLRNVLLGKAKKTPDTEINSDEPICEGMINCEDLDG